MSTSEAADALIERLVKLCSNDERIVAAFLGGSRARDEADAYSDVDVTLIVADDVYAEVVAKKDVLLGGLGEPLFIEQFMAENPTFVIFADGVELELHVFRVADLSSIRSGPHRVLLDKQGVLEGMEFPLPEPNREEQTAELRQILLWFWHDVGHFTTAIGRGHLWWAAGQLEQLRSYCVNLVRVGQGTAFEDEPYWKLDDEISTDDIEELRSTFVPVERKAMLQAARNVVAFFRRAAPPVANANGLPYPSDLADLITGHLERLPDDTA
jgi:predicted nucleotidyltransferase